MLHLKFLLYSYVKQWTQDLFLLLLVRISRDGYTVVCWMFYCYTIEVDIDGTCSSKKKKKKKRLLICMQSTDLSEFSVTGS